MINSLSRSTVEKRMYAPVVMIAYNRPDLIRWTMNNVALADGAANHEIFMFIDGPRNEDDELKQELIYSSVISYQARLPRLKVIRRGRNYGCRGNIVDAISQIISKYGRAIIVEDDILVSRTFLDYMDEALSFYENDKRIWSINAYQSPVLQIPSDYPHDVYLNPVNMCWGWGTWADRWGQVDFDLKDWGAMRNDPDMIMKLNKAGRHLRGMIERQYAGQLKTWDVQCAYHVVKNGLMSIEPKYQLSKNIGFNSLVGGEHYTMDLPFLSRQRYYNFRPRLVANLGNDPRIFRQFEWVVQNKNFMVRVCRKIQRVLAHFKPLNLEPKDI